MNRFSLRPILVPLVVAALCFVVSQRPSEARKDGVIAQFAGRAVSVADERPEGAIDILIQRWSTDAERESLVGTLVKSGPDTLLPALQNLRRRAGVVLMPGVQELGARTRTRTPRNLLFARDIMTPKGRRIIAAAGQHLGIGESARHARLNETEEFTLIDIRFGPDGKGVGKLASADDVVYDKNMRVLEVKNYADMPVRLVDVRVVEQPYR
jgi:hypothetical protein